MAHSAGSTSSESQKRGTSVSAADSASNTRTRQGTRLPESRQRDAAHPSRGWPELVSGCARRAGFGSCPRGSPASARTMIVRGIRAFVLRDLVDEGPAIPRRPWVGQGGGSAPGGATYGPAPREAWVRRAWLHVLVREREAVLESARLSGACSRRARLHNKAFKLARSAERVRGHSACTSRPRPGMLLAQLKAKDVRSRPNRASGAIRLGPSLLCRCRGPFSLRDPPICS